MPAHESRMFCWTKADPKLQNATCPGCRKVESEQETAVNTTHCLASDCAPRFPDKDIGFDCNCNLSDKESGILTFGSPYLVEAADSLKANKKARFRRTIKPNIE